MAPPCATVVQLGDERALIYYPEGGISYEQHIRGVGWVLNDSPGSGIEMQAELLRDWQQHRLKQSALSGN